MKSNYFWNLSSQDLFRVGWTQHQYEKVSSERQKVVRTSYKHFWATWRHQELEIRAMSHISDLTWLANLIMHNKQFLMQLWKKQEISRKLVLILIFENAEKFDEILENFENSIFDENISKLLNFRIMEIFDYIKK